MSAVVVAGHFDTWCDSHDMRYGGLCLGKRP